MSEATNQGTAESASHDQTPGNSRTPSIDDNAKRTVEIFSSRPFTFVVGPEQTQFVIHSKLLERLSQPLHNLMNNDAMTEAIERVAYLEDIDTQTFSDFVDFAYAFASVSDTALEEEKNSDGSWCYENFLDTFRTSCHEHGRDWRPENVGTFHIACDAGQHHISTDVIEALLQVQRNLSYDTSSMYGLAMEYVADRKRKCDEGSKAYLTSAAKLYVFADRYLVGGLKLVALHKLRDDFLEMPYHFSEVPCSPQSAEDFLELLNLAFEYGVTIDKGRLRMTDLQRLVILIALHKRKVLEESADFWEVLNHNSHIGMAVFGAWTDLSTVLDWEYM